MKSKHRPEKKKVLWFSHHPMTWEQQFALGNCEINHIDRMIESVDEIQDEIDKSDIIAVVAPIELQQEFFRAAGGKPVITCVIEHSHSTSTNTKPTYTFVKWQQIDKIEIKKHDFVLE